MTAGAEDRRTPEPGRRGDRFWRRAGATYALALAGGGAAAAAGLPLPWMLGPFFACGAASAFGARLAFLPMGRELGQVAIGFAVGLRFTPATLAAAAALLPAMIGATVWVIAFTFAAALLFRPLGGADRTTAFFATAAGGVADMAVVAREKGGDAGAVSIVHALRVSSTVAIVPILVTAFGEPGAGAAAAPPAAASDLLAFGLGLAGAVLAARALKPTPIPNPWLLGPMVFGLVLGATGLLVQPAPPLLIVVAQIALGTWLGCRFTRKTLAAAPRTAAAGLAISLFMIASAGLGAVGLSAATGLPATTSFLAMAPAAVTEMVITAKVMNLDAELVTAFHVMRIAIVCSTVLIVFRLYERLLGAPGGAAR